MPSIYNQLSAPVTLVTKGRGVERFESSYQLFSRLGEIPRLRDSILQIDHGTKTLTADSIAALETMLWLGGFEYFKRAVKRQKAPFSRFGTKYAWTYLGEYLGFDWRDKRECGK